jgi:hypothetical protein
MKEHIKNKSHKLDGSEYELIRSTGQYRIVEETARYTYKKLSLTYSCYCNLTNINFVPKNPSGDMICTECLGDINENTLFRLKETVEWVADHKYINNYIS